MQAQRFDAAIDMICFSAQDAQSALAAFRGVKHLVHCSTVCTYGVEYDWFPASEDHPLRPISDYRYILYGILLVLMMVFRPQGVIDPALLRRFRRSGEGTPA